MGNVEIQIKTRVCTFCRIEKLLIEFNKHNGRNSDNVQDWCKQCRRENISITKYGISTIEEILKQNNICLICKQKFIIGDFKKDPNIDHNHLTGKFRGILCKECNILLGMAKDNIQILIKAIEYLKNNQIQENKTGLSKKNTSILLQLCNKR